MGFQNLRMAPGPDPKGFPRPKMSLELALAMLRLVGAGFSHAAAGALAGFMVFQNWRMAPGPDPKGFPRPKMSLELALAMLRLAPSLVLWDFKTDGWPPVPISKASPGPKCCWSWRLGWFYGISKLTDGPLSRSMAPCPDLKGFPKPKMSLELALAMLRLPPWLVLYTFKTDGWPPVPIPKASPGPKCRWSWLLPCCGNGFAGVAFFVTLATLVSPPANASSSRVSPTVSHALREFVPTNARTTLLHRTLDTCGGAAASPCSHVRPGHKIGCRIFRGGSLALSAQYLPHCLRKRDNNKQTFCPRRARPWLEIARRADATLGRYGPCTWLEIWMENMNVCHGA